MSSQRERRRSGSDRGAYELLLFGRSALVGGVADGLLELADELMDRPEKLSVTGVIEQRPQLLPIDAINAKDSSLVPIHDDVMARSREKEDHLEVVLDGRSREEDARGGGDLAHRLREVDPVVLDLVSLVQDHHIPRDVEEGLQLGRYRAVRGEADASLVIEHLPTSQELEVEDVKEGERRGPCP